MLTVGSLFAGIGGFDLGFERAGMRTVWQVEQSEFCRRVLAQHFPTAHRFNDVCEVTGSVERWQREGGTLLEYVDVLCGGFPCQDLSYAGKGAGIEGERSGLWSEYARIVGELRPRYVVVENVPALLARGLGRVVGDLAASGYDAEWDCIPASALGAPHQRDRIWIVAYPGSAGLEGHGSASGAQAQEPDTRSASGARLLADPYSVGRERPGSPRHGRAGSADSGRGERVRNANSASANALPEARPPRQATGEPGWWTSEPQVGRVADGFPGRVDELRSLGNALVPQVAEWIGRRILEYEEGRIAA